MTDEDEYRLALTVAALLAVINRLVPVMGGLPPAEQLAIADEMDAAVLVLRGDVAPATMH